jgi:TonB family protein
MLRIGTMVALFACCSLVLSSVGFAQTGAPARVQVSNQIMLGRVEHKTMPVYPEEAMKKGIQGDVVFKIDVDETGKITASVPVSGDPLLTTASKEALRTFSFHPYLVDGSPTAVETQLGFHFAVQKTTDGVNGHVECMASIPNRP